MTGYERDAMVALPEIARQLKRIADVLEHWVENTDAAVDTITKKLMEGGDEPDQQT